MYLASATGTAGFEKLVAIKRILPHMVENGEFVRMFIDEARISATLTQRGARTSRPCVPITMPMVRRRTRLKV